MQDTALAAEDAFSIFKSHLVNIGVNPKYVDVIVRRWEDFTGKQATREADGVAFDDQAWTSGTVEMPT